MKAKLLIEKISVLTWRDVFQVRVCKECKQKQKLQLLIERFCMLEYNTKRQHRRSQTAK